MALLTVLLLCTVPVRTDDPVSSNVRFSGEIIRILDRKCLHCHSNDGLAMPLSNYRDVRSWGRAIREEIVEQRMPPWSAARGYRRFQNELALTSREATTILSWLDGGMPRGDDRDLPKPSPPAAVKRPDLQLTVTPQRVPALDDRIVRRVSVDTNLDVDRAIARVVVNPGHRSVLRAALVFVGDPDREGRWLGAWLPWQHEIAPPERSAFRLPARARLTVELHYRGGERETTDQPTIDLFFAPDPRQSVDDVIAAAASPLRMTSSSTIWAILPSADSATKSMELTARRPNGSTEVLLWIPELRHEWPQALVLQDPVTMPAGTTVSLVAHPLGAVARARVSIVK
jgi:hypothetical protein